MKRKRLTEFQVKKILQLRDAGVAWPEVADAVGVTAHTAWCAWRRHRPAHPLGKRWMADEDARNEAFRKKHELHRKREAQRAEGR